MERWLRDIENFLVASDRFEEEIDGRNFDLIRKALERMKPVVIKPEKTDEYHPDGSVYLIRCVNCKQEFKLIGFMFSSEIRHCPKCGQAQQMDWSE